MKAGRERNFWVALGLITGLALLAVIPNVGEVIWYVMFGWLIFLSERIPQVTVRWDGLLILVIGVIGCVLISHRMLGWLFSGTSIRWTFGASAASVTLMLTLFVAGISFLGIVHQLVWLATSDEPLLSETLMRQPGMLGRVPAIHDREKELLIGMENYGDAMNHFPLTPKLDHGSWQTRERPTNVSTARVGEASAQGTEYGANPPHSWISQILPFHGYQRIRLEQRWDSPENQPMTRAVIPGLLTPRFKTPPLRNEQGYGLSYYAANQEVIQRDNPAFDFDGYRSHTMLIGEVTSRLEPWAYPDNCRDLTLGLQHPEGFGVPGGRGPTIVGMMDLSTRPLSPDTDPQVLRQLAAPWKAEPKTSDD